MNKTGLKRPQASLTVDTVLESIQQALQKDANVQLIRFGTFARSENLLHEKGGIQVPENLLSFLRKKHLPLKPVNN